MVMGLGLAAVGNRVVGLVYLFFVYGKTKLNLLMVMINIKRR